MIRHIFAFLAIFLAAVPSVGARSLPEGVTMHRVQAGDPDSTGWIQAESTMGAFSVRLPLKFNDFTIQSPQPDAPVSKTFVVGGKSVEGVKYTAARLLYRDDATAQSYFARIEGGKTFPAEKSPTIRSHEVDGNRAVDIRLNDGRLQGYLRYILFDDSVMFLVVEVPVAHTELVSESAVQAFFNSLHVSRL